MPYITYVFDAILSTSIYIFDAIYIFESPLVKHRHYEFILCFVPFCTANASYRNACPRVII